MKCECGCGQETTVYHGKSRRFITGHNSFCNLNTLGKKHTDTTKRKMSDANKGRRHTKDAKKKMKGRKLSDITRQKIGEASRGRNLGENHPNWKGGISFGKYCPKFNDRIKEKIRDKFGRVCFLCGKPEDNNGRKLDVHHIDYNKMQGCDGNEWRLVPLCASCHGKTSNGDREYCESLIIEKLEEVKNK